MNALDRMAGGPDDNSAQGNHLVSFYDTGGSQGGFARTDNVSPTLKIGSSVGAPAGIGVTVASGVRRLTPRECERLQGFPDNWTLIPGLKCPDSRRYAAMGNAVTVNVAEWIGRRILASRSTRSAP